MKTDVLGVLFDNVTMEEALDRAEELASDGVGHYIVTPNPEFIQTAKRDADFRTILNHADLSVADGIGVIYAAKLLGTPLKAKLPGIELAAGLCERMAERGQKLFLLGAKSGVAELAGENLRARYAGLTVCGVHDGYFQEDAPVVEQIKRSGADVVFVCLGAPKQEQWMAHNGEACGAKLLLGLGGSLDVFAGQVKRAPEGWQKLGLEWLYRLIKQPSRLGRMARLPLVLVEAVAVRLSGRRGGEQWQER